MSYTPRTWVTGEIVTAPKLNNMEDGISTNDQAIATINQDITNIQGDIVTINGSIGDIQGDIRGINNDVDALETASGKTNASIAESFSAIKDYVKGDIVMYEGSTYVFTEDHAAGAWTGDDVETMSVATQLKSDLSESEAEQYLLSDDVPNTVQHYTFSGSSVSQVTHMRDSEAIRTDTFTYGDNQITEVRTLNTGESLTIVTNLATLETAVTFSAA